MNNARRKVVRNVICELKKKNPDWDMIESELTDVLDEETDAMENIPESLQDTERYQTCEESVDYLDSAIGEIDPDDPECAESIIDLLEQIDGI
ncbi:MAG: hypothetical protein ACI4TK_05770 [Agathobacter sp.]